MAELLLDLLLLVLHFLPAILLALPVLIWAYCQLRIEKQWRMALGTVGGLAGAAAAICLAAGIPQATQREWSAGRLAPAAAWLRGYELYYPSGEGPTLVQMYGPVSAMIYAPAAVMPRPTVAIIVGAFIGAFWFIAPAAYFLVRANPGYRVVFGLTGLAVFVLIASRQHLLSEAATAVTIDGPAFGLAVCAFAVLVGGSRDRPGMKGMLCGVLVALSTWTKLTFAPVGAAVLVYAFLVWEVRLAIRFAAAMCGACLIVSGLFLAWFGSEMLFQMIVLPASQPWKWPGLSPTQAMIKSARELWRWARPVGWTSIAILLVRSDLPGWRRSEWREWARRNPWLLPLLGAAAMLCTASLAYVKYGGAGNNADGPFAMLLLAGLGSLSSACGGNSNPAGVVPRGQRFARVTLAALAFASCYPSPMTLPWVSSGLSAWTELGHNEHEIAYRYARTHPRQVFLPMHPLSTLLADRRADHFSAGYDDIVVAGMKFGEEQLQAFLPPELREIAVYGDPAAQILSRLPEFSRRQEDPSLPGWTVLSRQPVTE